MKPVVGIIPSIGIERDRIFLLKDYMTSIRDAGGLPVVLFPETDTGNIRTSLKLCDGLVFSGGEDVNPALYGENNDRGLSNCCDERDLSEMMFLKEAMALKMPIFGICRGIQSLNVALGGTLYQDISISGSAYAEPFRSKANPFGKGKEGKRALPAVRRRNGYSQQLPSSGDKRSGERADLFGRVRRWIV